MLDVDDDDCLDVVICAMKKKSARRSATACKLPRAIKDTLCVAKSTLLTQCGEGCDVLFRQCTHVRQRQTRTLRHV